jgi:ubiquinone/menaquinone biosynthesis C-methylase UbiE
VTQVDRVNNATEVCRWNGASGRYWITNRERHVASHRNLLPHLFETAAISPGDRVIDVGCGCGETTITAARAASNVDFAETGWAVGVDLSGPMLKVAGRLAGRARVANVRFVQADAQACPLRRGSCDIIISSFGVMFFEDPLTAFTSFADIARPGGRLAFLCWQRDSENDFLAIPLRAFGAYTQLPAPAVADLFGEPRQVTSLLNRAGWRNICVEAITESAWMGSDVPDVMSYVRGMPAVLSLAAALGDETLIEQVLATIAEQYAARQCSDGVWVRAAAWLVTAHLS